MFDVTFQKVPVLDQKAPAGTKDRRLCGQMRKNWSFVIQNTGCLGQDIVDQNVLPSVRQPGLGHRSGVLQLGNGPKHSRMAKNKILDYSDVAFNDPLFKSY